MTPPANLRTIAREAEASRARALELRQAAETRRRIRKVDYAIVAAFIVAALLIWIGGLA